MSIQKSIYLAALLFLGTGAKANISLPRIFSDHMVLQQDTTITIWGWGKPNEMVKITGSWEPEKTYSLKVNSSSSWSIDLDTPKAGGPFQLSILGYNSVVIDDVLIGEVWLGSGQSNMEWVINNTNHAEKEIAESKYPQIRLLTVTKATAYQPQKDIEGGQWLECNPQTVGDFSAVAYFFGRKLNKDLNILLNITGASFLSNR